jgi:hypothetical protein
MEEERAGFGPDLAILQILCRQMLGERRGIVRGVCGAGKEGYQQRTATRMKAIA